jgi:hypothetical protein
VDEITHLGKIWNRIPKGIAITVQFIKLWLQLGLLRLDISASGYFGVWISASVIRFVTRVHRPADPTVAESVRGLLQNPGLPRGGGSGSGGTTPLGTITTDAVILARVRSCRVLCSVLGVGISINQSLSKWRFDKYRRSDIRPPSLFGADVQLVMGIKKRSHIETVPGDFEIYLCDYMIN